jgi:hypothetical protein
MSAIGRSPKNGRKCCSRYERWPALVLTSKCRLGHQTSSTYARNLVRPADRSSHDPSSTLASARRAARSAARCELNVPRSVDDHGDRGRARCSGGPLRGDASPANKKVQVRGSVRDKSDRASFVKVGRQFLGADLRTDSDGPVQGLCRGRPAGSPTTRSLHNRDVKFGDFAHEICNLSHCECYF